MHRSPLNYDLSAGVIRFDTETSLGYLSLPIMLLVRYPLTPQIQPYITAGFYGALLLLSSGEQAGNEIENSDLPFNRVDGGGLFGIGSYFILSKALGTVSVELRYTGSGVNLANNDLKVGPATPLKEAVYEVNQWALNLTYFF